MTCRELFVRDHPDQDLERAILETCPHDFGIRSVGGDLCLQDYRTLQLQDCRKCWEQEAEMEGSPSSAPSGHLPPLGEGLSFEQEAELTGTDMHGGIRRDEAGNVIDWGIVGPPGEIGTMEAEE